MSFPSSPHQAAKKAPTAEKGEMKPIIPLDFAAERETITLNYSLLLTHARP